jgi:hypothetical protein
VDVGEDPPGDALVVVVVLVESVGVVTPAPPPAPTDEDGVVEPPAGEPDPDWPALEPPLEVVVVCSAPEPLPEAIPFDAL